MSDSPPSAIAEANEPGQSSVHAVSTDLTQEVETWARIKGVDTFRFACAKAFAAWPIGQCVTEADFDKAVKASSEVEFR